MEPTTDDPTIIATAELPRIGRANEPRHVYLHEGLGSILFTMEIDPTNFEDVVGPKVYKEYLDGVDARRGTHYAYTDNETPKRGITNTIKS